MGTVLGPVLLIQIAVAVVIVCVLKLMLEHMMIEIALNELSVIPQNTPIPSEIVVFTSKELKPAKKQGLEKLVTQRFRSGIPIIYKIDGAMWGGMTIKFGLITVGHSLRDRLREGGFVR
jgi:F0F1-type ATP synthase delta subunit